LVISFLAPRPCPVAGPSLCAGHRPGGKSGPIQPASAAGIRTTSHCGRTGAQKPVVIGFLTFRNRPARIGSLFHRVLGGWAVANPPLGLRGQIALEGLFEVLANRVASTSARLVGRDRVKGSELGSGFISIGSL
jgi:hypothetical protein